MTLPPELLAIDPFCAADAARLGIGARTLQDAVRRGDLTRVRRGWFSAQTPGLDHRAAYLLRCRAASVLTGLALTGPSALAAHGLPVWEVAERPIHLAGPPESRRTRRDLRIVSAVTDDPPEQGVVPVREAVLSASLVDPVLGLAAADHAVRTGRLTTEGLLEALTALDGRRGCAAARRALLLVDPRRESAGESRLAWLLAGWGVDVLPQAAIDLGGRLVHPDFLVVGTRVVVEFDGLAEYRQPGDLAAEKRREDELRRLGFTVVRVLWSDLYLPDRLRRRILDAIAFDAAACA